MRSGAKGGHPDPLVRASLGVDASRTTNASCHVSMGHLDRVASGRKKN